MAAAIQTDQRTRAAVKVAIDIPQGSTPSRRGSVPPPSGRPDHHASQGEDGTAAAKTNIPERSSPSR